MGVVEMKEFKIHHPVAGLFANLINPIYSNHSTILFLEFILIIVSENCVIFMIVYLANKIFSTLLAS